MFMLMMVCMVTGVTLTTSCGNHRHESSYFDYRDSVEIAKIAKSVMLKGSDVEFKDPQEFLIYVVHNRDIRNSEDIVYNLSDNILSGITYSLSAKKKKLSLISIADEYLEHKEFYDGFSKGVPLDATPPLTTSRLNCSTDSAKEGGPDDE